MSEKQFKRRFLTSIVDEVYEEQEENTRHHLKPLVEALFQKFKTSWIEEMEYRLLSDTKEDFLQLSEEQAKEKTRKDLIEHIARFCTNRFLKHRYILEI